MIGAHRVAVTRAFRKLEEAGAVELRERRIHVKDIEALGHAANEKQRAKRIANFA
jgi:DNA-binding transcriptional regulator YhcF (GntR family)